MKAILAAVGIVVLVALVYVFVKYRQIQQAATGAAKEIAAGRTGGLGRARSIVEAALRAYALDFGMDAEVTCTDPSILDAQPGS